MPDLRCSMTTGHTVDKNGEPGDEIVCGKPATRSMGQPVEQTPGAHPNAVMDMVLDDLVVAGVHNS
jgi:hypothetical protein